MFAHGRKLISDMPHVPCALKIRRVLANGSHVVILILLFIVNSSIFVHKRIALSPIHLEPYAYNILRECANESHDIILLFINKSNFSIFLHCCKLSSVIWRDNDNSRIDFAKELHIIISLYLASNFTIFTHERMYLSLQTLPQCTFFTYIPFFTALVMSFLTVIVLLYNTLYPLSYADIMLSLFNE